MGVGFGLAALWSSIKSKRAKVKLPVFPDADRIAVFCGSSTPTDGTRTAVAMDLLMVLWFRKTSLCTLLSSKRLNLNRLLRAVLFPFLIIMYFTCYMFARMAGLLI